MRVAGSALVLLAFAWLVRIGCSEREAASNVVRLLQCEQSTIMPMEVHLGDGGSTQIRNPFLFQQVGPVSPVTARRT